MKTFENLIIETKNKVTTLIINRPKKLNALNKQTISELNECLVNLREDSDTRVIIITGSGNKAFVAGADISEFANFTKQQGKDLARNGQNDLFNMIEEFPKPIIAAINGFALGGGLELAMAAHFRTASNSAKVGLPEVTLGVIPGYGGTQRLTQLIGKGKAMEMILTAQMLNADDALKYNLVNYITTDNELIDFTQKIAEKICRNSPNAIKEAILSINAGLKDSINGYEVEIENFGNCFETNDFIEGTTAFLEKRKANF